MIDRSHRPLHRPLRTLDKVGDHHRRANRDRRARIDRRTASKVTRAGTRMLLVVRMFPTFGRAAGVADGQCLMHGSTHRDENRDEDCDEGGTKPAQRYDS